MKRLKKLTTLTLTGAVLAVATAPGLAAERITNEIYHLQNFGPANAVHHVVPVTTVGGGTELGLADGTVLKVPALVRVGGALRVGAWVHGKFIKSVDGKNQVLWLEVASPAGNR